MAAFAWSLAAASAGSAVSAEAAPRTIDVQAGPLASSIRTLSEEAGVSIGYSGAMPSVRTNAVRRAATAADALRQMLDGTGYRAVQTGQSSFRIEAAPAVRDAVPEPPPPAEEPEVIVTALKRAVPLSRTPATVHVVKEADVSREGIVPGSADLGQQTPALSITDLGPGLNRIFLRGIGDGPLDGFDQGSVAILMNEARLNYDAPDPDWALVDVGQVEVLEGPQGPLYGTGALGGIVKVETRRPDPSMASADVRAGLMMTSDGDVSNAEVAILNLPANDRLALRAVGYQQRQSGWIDNFGASSDINGQRVTGARLAARWLPPGGWTVDLSGATQTRRSSDSQYVDGGIGPLERPSRLSEPREMDSNFLILTVNGPIGGLGLTSISSISGQAVSAFYDATPLAAVLHSSGATQADDNRHYRLIDQEVRLSSPGGGSFDWLAGASLISATTKAKVSIMDSTGTRTLLTLDRTITEAALFGETGLAVSDTVRIGEGARLFLSRVDDEGSQGGAETAQGNRRLRASGSLDIGWTPSSNRIFFLRASTAYRPGGTNVQPDASESYFRADNLAEIEAGTRLRFGSRIAMDASVYAARWRRVQSDELLANGLVATRNAGNAWNYGFEGHADWSPRPGLKLSAGLMAQSSRVDNNIALQLEDRRLPVVPQLTGRVQLAKEFRVAGWKGSAEVGGQYVGATHLSLDPGLDRRIAGRAVVDASLSLSKGPWTASLFGRNLANSTADSFAFGNPYRVMSAPQQTPLQPRTIGLSLGRRF